MNTTIKRGFSVIRIKALKFTYHGLYSIKNYEFLSVVIKQDYDYLFAIPTTCHGLYTCLCPLVKILNQPMNFLRVRNLITCACFTFLI
jgi:hypothetical protein